MLKEIEMNLGSNLNLLVDLLVGSTRIGHRQTPLGLNSCSRGGGVSSARYSNDTSIAPSSQFLHLEAALYFPSFPSCSVCFPSTTPKLLRRLPSTWPFSTRRGDITWWYPCNTFIQWKYDMCHWVLPWDDARVALRTFSEWWALIHLFCSPNALVLWWWCVTSQIDVYDIQIFHSKYLVAIITFNSRVR